MLCIYLFQRSDEIYCFRTNRVKNMNCFSILWSPVLDMRIHFFYLLLPRIKNLFSHFSKSMTTMY